MPFDPTPAQYQDSNAAPQHPSRRLIEATSQERHRQYNASNESASQRGEAGGSVDGTKPEPQPVPEATDEDWIVVRSAPSLVDSNASSGEPNHLRPPALGVGETLTADKLQLHDRMFDGGLHQRFWDKERRRSVIAKKGKGTTTWLSNDDADNLGPWVPVNNSYESDIRAIGSWADMSRPPVTLRSELFSLRSEPA